MLDCAIIMLGVAMSYKRVEYSMVYLSDSVFNLTYVEPTKRYPLVEVLECTYTHSADSLSDCSIVVLPEVAANIKPDAFIDVRLGKYKLGRFQIARKNFRRNTTGLETLAVPYLSELYSDLTNFDFTNTTLDVVIGNLVKGFGVDIRMEIPPYSVNMPTVNTTTIDFLRMLASRFGFTFYLEDGKLILADESYLNRLPAIATLTPSNIGKDININLDTIAAYWMCEYTYNFPLPGNEKTIKVVSTKNAFSSLTTLRPREVLKITSNSLFETPIEAFAKAYKALKKANSANFSGKITVLGNERFTAVDVVELAGLGELDGRWRVQQAVHSQAGRKIYDTELTIAKIFEVDEDNFWTYETALDLIASGAINLIDGLPIIGS